jgi:hypothetical protein
MQSCHGVLTNRTGTNAAPRAGPAAPCCRRGWAERSTSPRLCSVHEHWAESRAATARLGKNSHASSIYPSLQSERLPANEMVLSLRPPGAGDDCATTACQWMPTQALFMLRGLC